MLSLLTAILLSAVLPEPFDQIKLDPQQEKKATVIIAKYSHVNFDDKAIQTKFRSDFSKILTKDQLADLDKMIKEYNGGVPIGEELYRNFKLEPFTNVKEGHYVADKQRISSILESGIKFTVTNKGKTPQAGTIAVQLFDDQGVRIKYCEEDLKELQPGKTSELRVVIDSEEISTFLGVAGAAVRLKSKEHNIDSKRIDVTFKPKTDSK